MRIFEGLRAVNQQLLYKKLLHKELQQMNFVKSRIWVLNRSATKSDNCCKSLNYSHSKIVEPKRKEARIQKLKLQKNIIQLRVAQGEFELVWKIKRACRSWGEKIHGLCVQLRTLWATGTVLVGKHQNQKS